MKWVTRRHARVNRLATAWLIRRFIDRQAELLFVAPEEVARVQREQGAKGFDAPGATYPHKDAHGRCSFEALVDEHRPEDPPGTLATVSTLTAGTIVTSPSCASTLAVTAAPF
jgi:hypothetical protein